MPPPIVLRFERGAAAGWRQLLAGEPVVSDRRLLPDARRTEPAEPGIPAFDERSARVVFDGPAPDAGATRRVVARIDGAGTRSIEHEDGERFLLAAAGDLVVRDRAPVTGSAAAALERGLGAPLALALAGRGIHLLHASAVDFGGGAVALTAASGVGKSTLAARAGEAGAVRLADDVLPVVLAARARARPRFPQLKLPAPAQVRESAPAELPLRALVELVRGDPAAPVVLERLEGAAAALALAGATVAARLFDRDALAGHLEACTAASRGIEVLRLSFPSGLERVPELLRRLGASLG